MRRAAAASALLLAAALAGCHKPGAGPGGGVAQGAWSQREALEGPMALWGPPGAPVGQEVLSVTCLPRPRRTLVVTVFGPRTGGSPLSGDLVVSADRNVVRAPLALKDAGAAEARIPAEDGLVGAWESARDLRFDVSGSPGAGAHVGAADAPLKRVLAACR